ncbi:MAG: hypothetical protein IKN53_01735 [Oscillibacter sp.]|nr:hypothetical protein [Oscillibacter sp.]
MCLIGGFFVPSAPWEALLPEEIERLRDPARAASRCWDLLVLTPRGARALADAPLRARVLLLSGESVPPKLRAETVVTCGLSARHSVTLSGVEEAVLCVQRTVPLLCGGTLEPQEFPLAGVTDAVERLAYLAARLLWTGSPYIE